MKILLAGAWQFDFYESACAEALKKMGVEVAGFSWQPYFRGNFGKVQLKWVLPGPAVAKLNRDLLAEVRHYKPDVVLVWRGTHILPKTLRTIRQRTGALLVSYNNDDPFSGQANPAIPLHQRRLWKYFLRNVPEYDLHFVYRPVNLGEINAAGAKEAHILMPYFIPALHHPVELTAEEKVEYGCEAVFVGHYEADGREAYLRALVDAGVQVKLFGSKYWTRRVLGSLTDYFGEVHPVLGPEYAKALCGAKMCLNFLSRLNRDTYNRRCFEITACGGLLLSQRTEDLQTLFLEGEEAVYFSSPAELVERALWLRGHDDTAQKIAQAGHERVFADDHSVDSRMRMLLEILSQARN
jgi:hypothetical protein